MKKALKLLALLLTIVMCAGNLAYADESSGGATGTVYEVGIGKPYENIGDVPLLDLKAGDTVLIHWRPEPYREKFVLCVEGTEEAPITIRGVPGPGGQLPVIDGNGAVTARGQNFWNEVRGLIKVGGANFTSVTTPKNIVIENLEVTGANYLNSFTDRYGNIVTYSYNAAGIFLESGENITIRNCRIHDNGNGIFAANATSNVLIERNHIFDNGNVGRDQEHNIYTECFGITFQYNYIGPIKAGSVGTSLKDRSAGTVIRYNWIDSGNRQLDLVNSSKESFYTHPSYKKTYVYGNILVESVPVGNRQIVHFGGEGTNYETHRGTLYFYNNTIVSKRTDATTLFRLSSSGVRVDARNNIFYVTGPGDTLEVCVSGGGGVLDLSHNWFKSGWVYCFTDDLQVIINDDHTSVVDKKAPKFVDEENGDYRLLPGASVVDRGTELHPDVPEEHALTMQYVVHQSGEPRPQSKEKPEDKHIDIGAYELPSGNELGEYMKEINSKK